MTDYKKQGKKNRVSGKLFEKLVQKDLEKIGWIVARWTKNVDNGLVDAKPKFNPFTKQLMMNSSGFPDFIRFRISSFPNYYVEGVECKVNGYLSKEEKEKVKWLIENKIFSQILVAKKSGKEINYESIN